VIEVGIEPLTRPAFAPFGEVIEVAGASSTPINGGHCDRYDDLATIDVSGRPLLSIFRGRPYSLPLTLTLVERHPLGSQAFFPLSGRPYLVIVAADQDGRPGLPRAFFAGPRQGVNIPRNGWHGVLTPLEAECDFLVVDRGGPGNLEEFTYSEPILVRYRS
jgi:ureidoglycolate lyase